MNKIQINSQSKIAKINFDNVRKIITLVLQNFKKSNKIVSLLFCDNDYMKKLNKQYRDKDYPTDVLSFEENDDEDFLGDIAISIEKAKEQCQDYDNTFNEEVIRLIIHGLLHLLGFDHEIGEDEKQIMEEWETSFFEEVKNLNVC